MKFLLIYLAFFLLFCISILFFSSPSPTAGDEVSTGEVDSGSALVMSNRTGMFTGGNCIADTC